MQNIPVTILIFAVVILIAILLLRPFFIHYIQNYQLRLRPQRSNDESSARKPRHSHVLSTCMVVGQVVLSSFPSLADKRAIELLQFSDYRTPQHLAIYTGIRTLAAASVLLFGVVSSAGSPLNFVLSVPAAILSWLVPNFFLSGRARQRQQKVIRELPIVIDLMIVCAQAGLGMLQALDKISNEAEDSCPTLSAELRQLINDVKIFAKSVPQSLMEMGERCGVDEVINLASALTAAEAKGADISYPLKQQAAALRDRLKRKREEEAGKVPVKMVPVIMIFVMPLTQVTCWQ